MRNDKLIPLNAFILWSLVCMSACLSAEAQSAADVAGQVGVTPESLVIADFDLPTASVIISRIDDAAELRQGIAAQQNLAGEAVATATGLSQLLVADETNEQLLACPSAQPTVPVSNRSQVALLGRTESGCCQAALDTVRDDEQTTGPVGPERSPR